jgi:hypothetical protein
VRVEGRNTIINASAASRIRMSHWNDGSTPT